MKAHRLFDWKMVVVSLALALAIVPAFAPVGVLAAPAQDCDPRNDKQCVDVCHDGSKCDAFMTNYINPIVKVLSALVGIAAVLSIIFAGIQYAGSADDSGVVTKAKQRIFNTIIGLMTYIFLVAFLNYLVPGGIW